VVYFTSVTYPRSPMKGTFFKFYKCILFWFVFFYLLNREVGEAPSDTMSEEVDSEVYPSEDGTLSINLPSFFPLISVHIYFGLSISSCLVRFLLFFFLKFFCSVFCFRSRLGISRERHKPSVVWQWVLFIFCLFKDVYFLFTNFSKPFLLKKITFIYFPNGLIYC